MAWIVKMQIPQTVLRNFDSVGLTQESVFLTFAPGDSDTPHLKNAD